MNPAVDKHPTDEELQVALEKARKDKRRSLTRTDRRQQAREEGDHPPSIWSKITPPASIKGGKRGRH